MADGYRDISTGTEDWGVESKPRKGAVLTYRGERIGTAGRVDGNLCWINYDEGGESWPFIWRFQRPRELNQLFDWPQKSRDGAPK